jgi:hypothetical protein
MYNEEEEEEEKNVARTSFSCYRIREKTKM